ncbi:hypothetical protein BGY98DRAFT_652007 [Russula aff. rugulosa BPL654]|nr:hypothetical protein BGY98DRAFT_652007 [Russula aff. rugulosa BPL654]
MRNQARTSYKIAVGKLVPLMQEPFPALTKLQIESNSSASDELPVLPDSFLGGSTPHLRFLCLEYILFPALPNLLRSASNLIYLFLDNIPSGYISPEMAAALSALSKLEVMHISFRYADTDSDLTVQAPPPLTRSVLPALNVLKLVGDGGYLDDFLGRIDVPSIKCLRIEFIDSRPFFNYFFHLPQLIGRVEKFRSLDYARFHLSPRAMEISLSPLRWARGSFPGELQLKSSYSTDGPLPHLMDAFNLSLLPLSNIKNINICAPYSSPDSQSGFYTGDPRWLEILRQFSGAKSLYLESMNLVPPVALALKQVIEEGMTDVLPAIQELTVFEPLSAGPVREAIEQFVTARGLSTFGTPPSSKWRISTRDTDEG